MILSFSKLEFVQKIFMGTKIHTIRKDKINRWKAGMKIHAWYGSPRNPKNNPYQFSIMMCCGVQSISIEYPTDYKKYLSTGVQFMPSINVNGRYLKYNEKEELAKNDGFENYKEFCEWFDKDFKGKIIHFTEGKKY